MTTMRQIKSEEKRAGSPPPAGLRDDVGAKGKAAKRDPLAGRFTRLRMMIPPRRSRTANATKGADVKGDPLAGRGARLRMTIPLRRTRTTIPPRRTQKASPRVFSLCSEDF